MKQKYLIGLILILSLLVVFEVVYLFVPRNKKTAPSPKATSTQLMASVTPILSPTQVPKSTDLAFNTYILDNLKTMNKADRVKGTFDILVEGKIVDIDKNGRDSFGEYTLRFLVKDTDEKYQPNAFYITPEYLPKLTLVNESDSADSGFTIEDLRVTDNIRVEMKWDITKFSYKTLESYKITKYTDAP